MQNFTEKYNCIDLLKFIMAITVIAIHIQPLANCENNIILAFYTSFIKLAVPFFFITTGFLLSRKLSRSKNDHSAIIRNAGFKIFKLYLIWSFIYIPLSFYYFLLMDFSVVDSIFLYLRNFIFYGEQYQAWPLWYLLSAFYALIIISFLYKKNTSNNLLLLSIACFIISKTLDWISVCNVTSYHSLKLIKEFITNTFINGRIFQGAIYIPLGMYISNVKLPKYIWQWLFIFSFMLNSVIDSTIMQSLFLVLSAISFFKCLYQVKMRNCAIFPLLRKASAIIYFLHMYVWILCSKIIYGEKIYGASCFIIVTLVTIIIAFLYIFIFKILNHYKKSKQVKIFS